MNIKFLLPAILLVIPLFLNAQIKEGSILYDMQIEGLPPEQAAMMGEMETRVTFKNGKTLTEVNSMMFNQQVSADENGMLMLMEQMGNRYAVKQTRAEMEKADAKSKDKAERPMVEYGNEVKVIAGYECKKAIVTVMDKDKKASKVEIWYCDRFENPSIESKTNGPSAMKGVKGMPFEYSTTMGSMKIKMVAKTISTDPVADSIFILNTDGYKMLTLEELSAMSGGK